MSQNVIDKCMVTFVLGHRTYMVPGHQLDNLVNVFSHMHEVDIEYDGTLRKIREPVEIGTYQVITEDHFNKRRLEQKLAGGSHG